MRKLISSFIVISIAAIFVASLADAQPGIGISKTSPLIGTGSSGSPLRIGPSTPCSTNEILKWNGSAWACAADASGSISDGDKGDITTSSSGSVWTIDDNVVSYAKMQDVSATNRILCRKTAGAGDPEECTASDVNTMLSSSNIAVGSGLSLGGINGPQTCSSGTCTMTISARDFGDITASASGATWTIDNGTVTAPKLSIDGDKGDITIGSSATTFNVDNDAITYAKMQNVSATSRILCRKTAGAGDVEECTGSDAATIIGGGISGLTTNTIPIATSATAIGDSTITKSGSAYTLTGSLNVSTTLSVSQYIESGTGLYTGTTNGVFILPTTNSINFGYADNATHTGYINAVGYNESTTQFRNLKIQDGKGADVIDVVGSTKAVGFSGPITFNAASNVGNELALSGTFSSNGTSTTLSNGTGDQVTIGGGELRDTGSAPSSFTCGTGASASGGRNWFRVTVGSSPTATCAITFSTAFGTTPTCSVTRGNSSARADSYISAISSSAMTISNDAGATLTNGAIFHIRCGG